MYQVAAWVILMGHGRIRHAQWCSIREHCHLLRFAWPISCILCSQLHPMAFMRDRLPYCGSHTAPASQKNNAFSPLLHACNGLLLEVQKLQLGPSPAAPYAIRAATGAQSL